METGLPPHFLVRTKALQDHSTLIYPKGDAITPLNPLAFESPHLSDGDILLSKDLFGVNPIGRKAVKVCSRQ